MVSIAGFGITISDLMLILTAFTFLFIILTPMASGSDFDILNTPNYIWDGFNTLWFHNFALFDKDQGACRTTMIPNFNAIVKNETNSGYVPAPQNVSNNTNQNHPAFEMFFGFGHFVQSFIMRTTVQVDENTTITTPTNNFMGLGAIGDFFGSLFAGTVNILITITNVIIFIMNMLVTCGWDVIGFIIGSAIVINWGIKLMPVFQLIVSIFGGILRLAGV